MPVSQPSSSYTSSESEGKMENSLSSVAEVDSALSASSDEDYEPETQPETDTFNLDVVRTQFLEKGTASVHSVGSASDVISDGEAYTKSIRTLDVDKPVERRLNDIYPKTSVSYHRNLKDVNCDSDHPRVLQFQHVSYAAYKIRGGIEKTPCPKSRQLSRLYEMDLYFKKEFLQATGSFKERGARNVLMKLLPEQKEKGVIAASAGNHALALSYHGHELGIPVTVVMPVVAPLMKVSLCRTYGANVMVLGDHIGESKEFAMRKAAEEGLMYVNGYDHLDILAGAGTMGLEILDDVSKVDAVVVPVGGGGLIAGIACAMKYLKPEVMIIGAEAQHCASMTKALEMGKPTYVKPGSTLADGLSVPMVGVNAFATAKDLVDKMVTVSEKDIARSILRLIEVEKAVVEGAGATGLAAIMSEQLPELKGKKSTMEQVRGFDRQFSRVVVPLCGGNIDTTVLGRTIERGLACEGRLVQFSVTVSDRPGGIAEMASIFAQEGASIKDIFHERAFMKLDIFSVRVRIVVETRDKNHAIELEKVLKAQYSDVRVLDGDGER